MNRQELLGRRENRMYEFGALECRDSTDGLHALFRGYASVTEHRYDVFGGPDSGGWNETVARGAFKKTLSENPDVVFLFNHDGMTLARTKSGTLELSEDKQGLRVDADLDPRMSAVSDLRVAVERGDVDEMSFGFKVEKDEWFDERGEPAHWLDGTERRILEVNLNKGDVSAVNYGANPATSGAFRAAELALAELRAGRQITDDQRAAIVSLVDEGPSPSELLAAHLMLREKPESIQELLKHHELLRI